MSSPKTDNQRDCLAGGSGEATCWTKTRQCMTNSATSGARSVGRRVITEAPWMTYANCLRRPTDNCSLLPSVYSFSGLSDVFADDQNWQPQSFRSHPVLGTPTPTLNYWRARVLDNKPCSMLIGRWPSGCLAWPRLPKCALSMCDRNRCRSAPMKRNTPPRLSAIFIGGWYSIFCSLLSL